MTDIVVRLSASRLVRPSRGSFAHALVLGVLCSGVSYASDSPPGTVARQTGDEAAARSAATKTILVTLVGMDQSARNLEGLIRELLEPHGLSLSFVQQSGLTIRELTAPPRTAQSPGTQIWVLVPDGHRAVLYFGQPSHDRFLHREIPLDNGLDQVGSEQVAQVVKSAAIALLEGEPALSREALETQVDPSALAPERGEPSESNDSGDPSTSAAPPERLPQAEVRPSGDAAQAAPATPGDPPARARPRDPSISLAAAVESAQPIAERGAEGATGGTGAGDPVSSGLRIGPTFAIGYTASWTGEAFGWRHGPSFAAGIRVREKRTAARGISWPLLVMWEPTFSQSYARQGIELSTRSQFAWLLIGSEFTVTHRLKTQVLAGPGCEFAHVTSRGGTSGDGEPSSSNVTSRHREIPRLRLEFGAAVELGEIELDTRLLIDLSLFATHYDVVVLGTDTHERFATPWVASPGIRIGANFF